MKSEAKMKANLDLPKAIGYLEDVVKSLKAGRVCITNCEKSLTLTPEAMVRLELEASQKDDRESISLRIAWRKQEEEETTQGDLHISPDDTPTNTSLEEVRSKSA
ncbi:MAG: amphi-Trp domain-containing protein [Phycisphaerae bacterium]|nr:amphi-Trp domain-containing protein [Phycisphaerae bacterium]